MALCAARLADCALEETQKRTLARYSFVFADAGLHWLRIWRNQLARSGDRASQRRAKTAKTSIRSLAAALCGGDGVRDYLGAKRQAAAGVRGDDIEATLRLWEAVEPERVRRICASARMAQDDLAGVEADDSVGIWAYLPDDLAASFRASLPRRDSDYWHLAADSAAALRPYTLPTEGGGLIGRRITQVNDVALHLDVLLAIAPTAEQHLAYDWLVRSAIGIELNALLDLTLGAPPGAKWNVLYPLTSLCRSQGQIEDADDLEQLRDGIGTEGWKYLRHFRNTLGAHLDTQMPIFEIARHLMELDYQGIIDLAYGILDFLDELGARSQSLAFLVLGERRIGSWPIDPTKAGSGRPSRPMASSLADMFKRFDSPGLAITGSSLGSAAVAGIMAGRQPQPRRRVTVAGHAPRPWLEPLPSRLTLEEHLNS